MRTRLAALGAAVLIAMSGCAKEAEPGQRLPPVRVVEPPAASAGGACILWDFAFIEQHLGVRFSVAASDQVADTSTCVVQTVDAPLPYLTLAVVETTRADAALFLAELKPAKAVRLKGLGKAGYRLTVPATGARGAVVEIGWLSDANQLQTLKFSFARGAEPATVVSMNAKLFSLAKAMNTSGG